MLVEIRGDVLKDPKDKPLIAIPVNSVGIAGKGMALWMKLAHQEAYKRYCSYCRRGKINHGEMLVVDVGRALLAMFPTKYHWAGPSDLDLIKKSTGRLIEFMKANGHVVAHLPHVGCGIKTGELDWTDQVKPIVEAVVVEHPTIELRVYGR